MEIARLRCVCQNLEKKNKELLLKLDELTKKNNLLSKENISLKYSHKEIPKQINNNNNNLTDRNKIIEELNKKIAKITKEKNELEKMNKNLKNINNELTKEKNDLEKRITQSLKDIEMINRNMKEMSEIKDNYREKYQRTNEELTNEKIKCKNLEKKFDEFFDNHNNININLLEDESKTRTYKNNKIKNRIEIELEKMTKTSHQSPQNTHRSLSRFSTNNTNNTKKIYNNLEDLEINPENYTVIKQIQINNLKWYLLKRTKKNNLIEAESSSKNIFQNKEMQPLYRRYQYLKFSSKAKKEKEKNNEDSYTDFIWKPFKDEKDFINFNLDNINKEDNNMENEKEKTINELQLHIKDLKEKLIKKENECNRINLNYAKLFKRTKKPEMTYEKLLEENDKLKSENRLLNLKIEKLNENKNFIGISFILDDLENSKFIDDEIFENILDEITKDRADKNTQQIITMKCFKSNEDFKNKENKTLEYENSINKKGKKEIKENKNEKNNIELKNNIKETLIEKNKDINENKEKEKNNGEINKNKINKNEKSIEKDIYKKIRTNRFVRYHITNSNTRDINGDNNNINEDINTKEKIYLKSNPKSLNLYSEKIVDLKNSKIEEVKEIISDRKTRFIKRRKFLKEKELDIK